MTAALLSVRDVSVSFKGIKALTDVSFDVEVGEIGALIGPNGAGKSSLLNVINGVYGSDSGEVLLAGKSLHGRRPLEAARSGVGRTFQNNALFSRMTVRDNVLAGLSRKSSSTMFENAFRIG